MAFVLSSDGQSLDPCPEARARELLDKGRAAVYLEYPFTIRLKDRTRAESVVHDHRLKFDPGSKTTGIAIVQEETGQVVFAAELTHRSSQIRDRLLARRAIRRSRRQRKTRYRRTRFLNRRRRDGWLAPSLQHRVETTATWTRRLMRLCPISTISMELVRFDTQLMQNAEISGIAYQQGELAGYEVREYLLDKWGRRCAYCGKTDIPLQVEHLIPKARGGSNRVSNLTLACDDCNQKKGNQTASEFGFPHLMERAKASLKDAAAVNSVRWALYRRLIATGLDVEAGTGGRTKFNRTRLDWEKTHWRDAACVGASTPMQLRVAISSVLLIAATGHGTRQMCGTNRWGFPIRHRSRQKRWFDFQTGDLVRAVVLSGKRKGTHRGRVLVRATGSFDITTKQGRQGGIGYRSCRIIQRADGYAYGLKPLKRGRKPLEIAQLLTRQPTPPQLSETAAHILRTLRDRRCSTGEPICLRMRDDGGAGSILWHGGATIGVQGVTVRRATFERLHRLALIEYDRDNPNGGKLYKLTPLGAAALRVYELEQKEAAGQ